MSTDAYIRLGGPTVRHHGQTEHHDGLVFVDAPLDSKLSDLRLAPYSLFRMANTMLVRTGSPVDSPCNGKGQTDYEEVVNQVERLDLAPHLRCGLLRQPVGAPAWVEGEIPEEEISTALERARAIELEALLQWGDGVWRPTAYHYLLPSGEHAAAFVRIADAVQTPRDAEAIASWMHDRLSPDMGIVVDTGTLTPVILALVAAMRSRLWNIGHISVLDGYPSTAFDVRRATTLARARGSVMGLLSVNSSGRVRDQMLEALHDASLDNTVLDVLVNKAPISSHEDHWESVLLRTWHPRPGQEPLVRYAGTTDDACALCGDSKTATLIPISPRSFDGSLPATLSKITPQVSDAERNSELWELCNRSPQNTGAISLDSRPHTSMQAWRAPGNMAIAFRHDRLLLDPNFREAAARSLRRELSKSDCEPSKPDLVLIPEHEYAMDGCSALIGAMKDILGETPSIVAFPVTSAWPEKLRLLVKEAKESIAILTLGAVTGTTLQTALAAVQASRDSHRYDLYAYVVHARLSEQRAWQTLENSYSRLIFAAWHSYLPDRSALQEERATLEGLSESQEQLLSQAGKRFLENRLRFLADVDVAAQGIFWGSDVETHLTPNSIFGQDLRGPAIYVAVCSAMERARKERRSEASPVRRVFEMPAIVRSYYDPMILAAILRWLRPHEAWWGYENTESLTIQSVLERATNEDLRILIPELLLASAQGKLNREGTTAVRAKAHAMLKSQRRGAKATVAIELGLAVAPDFTGAGPQTHSTRASRCSPP